MALNPYHHPFLFGPGFDELFAPTFMRDPFELMPVLRPFDKAENHILLRTSPGYEISETDEMYQISVDVPGIKADNMDISLEHEGRLVHISGGRKITKGDSVTETKFDKRFTIGNNVDVEKMTANLADGVLVLKAPKKEPKEKPKIRIPITEGPNAETVMKIA